MAITVFRGDKVVLIKPYEKMEQVGNNYEVADFTEANIILRDCITKIAVAAINVNDFSEYFMRVEDVRGWTEWQNIIDTDECLIGQYRTNQKKVEVKVYNGQRIIKGRAFCCKDDVFNLAFGIALAYKRAIKKIYIEDRENLVNALNETKTAIYNLEQQINKMCKR